MTEDTDCSEGAADQTTGGCEEQKNDSKNLLADRTTGGAHVRKG
jgi:hypothetical protein